MQGNCPHCQETIVFKLGKFGSFYECSVWSHCKWSISERQFNLLKKGKINSQEIYLEKEKYAKKTQQISSNHFTYLI